MAGAHSLSETLTAARGEQFVQCGKPERKVLFSVGILKKTPTKNNSESTVAERLLALARRKGTLRTSDAVASGIPAAYVRRLASQRALVQIARGRYRPADQANASPHHGLAIVAIKSPAAVVSLLSALGYHELTTQAPTEVWITIGHKARVPKLEWPSLQVTRATGAALVEGVERHAIEGVVVQIYSPAKTVADCFKYRNRVGLDVALEALKSFRQAHRGRMDELERYARICRVSRVMRPYLEALSS